MAVVIQVDMVGIPLPALQNTMHIQLGARLEYVDGHHPNSMSSSTRNDDRNIEHIDSFNLHTCLIHHFIIIGPNIRSPHASARRRHRRPSEQPRSENTPMTQRRHVYVKSAQYENPRNSSCMACERTGTR